MAEQALRQQNHSVKTLCNFDAMSFDFRSVFLISICVPSVTLVTSKRYKGLGAVRLVLQGGITKSINALQGVQNEIENTGHLVTVYVRTFEYKVNRFSFPVNVCK